MYEESRPICKYFIVGICISDLQIATVTAFVLFLHYFVDTLTVFAYCPAIPGSGSARRGETVKLIVTVVRPERLTAVKEALFRVGVTGMTLSRASGHGGEQEIVEHYRGSSVVLEFREKVRIEMAVSEPFVQPTIDAILQSARTGDVGDGKIFVQPLDHVIRIRTGEEDSDALTPVTAEEVRSRAQLIQELI
jgi:nitrogen regulatory protein P-II 1